MQTWVRCRRSASWGVVFSAVMTAAACGGADGNAVDPQGDTPYERVEVDGVKIWQTKWDNPAIGTIYNLQQGSKPAYAIRNGQAWHYNKFDLELEVSDADPTHRLYTFPRDFGTFGDDEQSFFYESRGLKLEPMEEGNPMSSISVATAYHDTWNGPELVVEDPLGNTEGRFQLDPAVGLVPLRVVVLDGPGLSTPLFNGAGLSPGWMSKKSSELLFDDMWHADKFKNTNPPISPDFAEGAWTHRPGVGKVANSPTSGGGRFLQPDRVLDQCDAQFRMISYHTCTVPADILYDGTCSGSLTQTGQVNAIRNHINNHCDVPDDVAKVIFVGSLGAGNCLEGQIRGAQFGDDVVITNSFADKKTLPHELGHLLGLGHTKAAGNLMAPGQGVDLNAEQCAKVNERAKSKQAEFWQKSKFSGDWKEAFPKKLGPIQREARAIWSTLDRNQVDKIHDTLGTGHYRMVIGAIDGSPAAWHAAEPNLEVLLAANAERLSEILSDEQVRRVQKLFSRR